MQVWRLFLMLGALVGLGLLAQPSAYARPTIAVSAASDCEMMGLDSAVDGATEKAIDCHDPKLGCVSGMPCISPLYWPEGTLQSPSPLQSDYLYTKLASREALSASRGPEPPPPQLHS